MSAPIFPLPFWPEMDYRTGGVSFGYDRTPDGDNLLHPACDLVVPAGTEIYAVENGTVLPIYKHAAYQFFESGPHVRDSSGKSVCAPGAKWLMVYELRIKHANFVARYGEIALRLPAGMGPDVDVKKGQHIAYVGAQSVHTMLHFEMFSDVHDPSSLTVKDNMKYINLPRPRFTYHRRKDLMNPTDYLQSCILLKTWIEMAEAPKYRGR